VNTLFAVAALLACANSIWIWWCLWHDHQAWGAWRSNPSTWRLSGLRLAFWLGMPLFAAYFAGWFLELVSSSGVLKNLGWALQVVAAIAFAWLIWRTLRRSRLPRLLVPPIWRYSEE